VNEYRDKLRMRYVNDPVKWATIVGFLLAIFGVFGPWATLDAVGIDISTDGNNILDARTVLP
jgi:hypothetical protein